MIIINKYPKLIQIDPKLIQSIETVQDLRDLGVILHSGIKVEAVDFFFDLKDGKRLTFRLENTDEFFLTEDAKYNGFVINNNTFKSFEETVYTVYNYFSGTILKERPGAFLVFVSARKQ